MWLLLLAAAAACPLARVLPAQGVALVHDGRDLPGGSVVERLPEQGGCAEVAVRVVAPHPWVWRADRGRLDEGDPACVPASALRAIEPGDVVFVPEPAPEASTPRLPVGTREAVAACSGRGLELATRVVPADQLSGAVVLSAEQAATQEQLLEDLRALGLSIPITQVRVGPWGRAALPMTTELDAAALAAEWAREGLDTRARREKATVAQGPHWSHFLGSDPPLSDLWGAPGFVAQLAALAVDWSAQCAALEGVPTAHCTLAVGDLSWHRDQRPDPLGHRDHTGRCVDLRLFRDDGSRYEAWWNRPDDRPGVTGGYDPALTRAFVAFALARPEVTTLLFNDPAAGARPARGHDDHLHLCME